MSIRKSLEKIEDFLTTVFNLDFETLTPWPEEGYEPDSVTTTIASSRYWGKLGLLEDPRIQECLNSLDLPHVLTKPDIVDCAVTHIPLGRVDDGLNGAFNRFVVELECLTSFTRKSQVFELLRGVRRGEIATDELVWEQNAYSIKLCGTVHAPRDPEKWEYWAGHWTRNVVDHGESASERQLESAPFQGETYSIQAQATGKCTARAMEDFVGAVQGVASVVEKSYRLTAREDALVEAKDAFPALRRCLNVSFGRAGIGRRDNHDRRLSNAVNLLREASRHANGAVSLALACAAMEALLSSKNDGNISEELGRNIATLLVPDGWDRLPCKKYVKKLYDTRSRVLHGTKVHLEDQRDRTKALQLAFAVLRAILEWRAYSERTGTDQKVEEFFDELEQAQFAGKGFVGVPPELNTWLARELEVDALLR